MDDDLERKVIMMIALKELKRALEPLPRILMRSGGENGAEFIHRMLTAHPSLCKEQLRLDRDIFIKLVNDLKTRNLLSDGRFVEVAEQVGISLHILGHGSGYRQAAEKFKHSLSTISKYVRGCLDAMRIFCVELIKPHQSLLEVPKNITNKSLYWPFFKDCVGAIDGTHIKATIGDKDGIPFRGRKHIKTWNVMASCSFDMLYTFINVGWEGSSHDISVWRDSLTDPKYGFPHPPPGKYYLVDLGYPNTLGYLSPYKDARYHLPEFNNGYPPEGVLENFNYRHSSLRSVIERSFGMLKSRWKILDRMPSFDEEYQIKTIMATFALHNFIILNEMGIEPSRDDPYAIIKSDYDMFHKSRRVLMDNARDQIALKIWRSKENPNSSEIAQNGDDDIINEDTFMEIDEHQDEAI